MKKNLFKYAKRFLPLIGIAILIVIILRLDFDKLKTALLSINPIFIVFSISLIIPLLVLRNFTWQIILKEQKIKISSLQSLKIYLIGLFYASITPGFLGQLMRIPYVKEKTGEPYGKLFVNTTIDTTIRTVAIYMMILVGTLLVIERFPQLFMINIVIFIILALVLFYFIKKERGEKLFYKLVKYLIPKKLKGISSNFVDTFYKDFPKINKLIIPLILSLITWIIVFTQEYLIVFAMGINIPYFYYIMLFPIANVAGYLPITIAGLGMREFTAILIFSTLFSVTSEQVLVFTLVGFVVTDLVTGLIGFFVSLTEATGKDVKSMKKIIAKD